MYFSIQNLKFYTYDHLQGRKIVVDLDYKDMTAFWVIYFPLFYCFLFCLRWGRLGWLLEGLIVFKKNLTRF